MSLGYAVDRREIRTANASFSKLTRRVPSRAKQKVPMMTDDRSQATSFAAVPDLAALAHAIIDTVRDPLLVLNNDLRIVAASRAFYQTFQFVDQGIHDMLIYKLDDGQWNIPELLSILEKITKDRVTVEGYEVDRDFPRVGRRVMLLNVRNVYYEEGGGQTILLAFEDVTDRRAIEEEVQNLLREKDMLLEEMQHRVSNSLQIIASILLMKARTVQSEESRQQLVDAHQRVLSVAAVQQHLHVAGHGARIDIANYLTKLCETLAHSMIGDSRAISLTVHAEKGPVASQQAVSMGLIVTELVMNALKHAFSDVKPDAAITVTFQVLDSDWELTISDNGSGTPDPDEGQTTGGLGVTLVKALATQLEAVVATTSNSRGTSVTITHATFKAKPVLAA